ncbi:MAG TPA: helix-turn-helix domain-containing protein [Actinospica sp.]|jgi:transcriptional regulator GlxA family with amidase domain|nr:helix-turn-helix domain-containing protein [Actinospica sp.]
MRRIALLLVDGARMFDVSVVTEVFRNDRLPAGQDLFELRTCGEGRRPVTLEHGAALTPQRGLSWLAGADLVIVPGVTTPLTPFPEPLLAALRAAHRRGTAIASLCLGAFVLAQAGLLDGRRAVTHWHRAGQLAELYPRILVEPSALYVEDGGIWTSAGVAGGIDLCLHLVRTAHGAETAACIARAMVVAPYRTGGQAQFVDAPIPMRDEGEDALAAVRERALGELGRPLSVPELAGWAGMSERTFARRFLAATGSTPAQWLIAQRVLHAQRLLEQTDLPIEQVAAASGFGSPVTLRQHFTGQVGVAPRDYRRSFRRAA